MGAGPSRRVSVDNKGQIFMSDELQKREGDLIGDAEVQVHPLALAAQELVEKEHAIHGLIGSVESLLSEQLQEGVTIGRETTMRGLQPKENERAMQQRIEELQNVLDETRYNFETALTAEVSQLTDALETTESRTAISLPCRAEEFSLLQCYKTDATKTLECSDLVQAYVQCAAASREEKYQH
eukprot:m.97799 g.97799  ORF g.97799 m.97799 type:complete len:183 (-) comp27012_c1_seq1:205-753(-)